jgi:hypothetical protein
MRLTDETTGLDVEFKDSGYPAQHPQGGTQVTIRGPNDEYTRLRWDAAVRLAEMILFMAYPHRVHEGRS